MNDHLYACLALICVSADALELNCFLHITAVVFGICREPGWPTLRDDIRTDSTTQQ
jgi:hypothetical protein